MKDEPLVFRSLVISAIAAIITLVVAFGIDISTEQKAAIMGVVASVSALVVAVWTRGKVTPVDEIEDVPLLEDE